MIVYYAGITSLANQIYVLSCKLVTPILPLRCRHEMFSQVFASLVDIFLAFAFCRYRLLLTLLISNLLFLCCFFFLSTSIIYRKATVLKLGKVYSRRKTPDTGQLNSAHKTECWLSLTLSYLKVIPISLQNSSCFPRGIADTGPFLIYPRSDESWF